MVTECSSLQLEIIDHVSPLEELQTSSHGRRMYDDDMLLKGGCPEV